MNQYLNNKFSVVIPTIWKSDCINELLESYYACDNIFEVILIDNDWKNKPEFPTHKKLTYVQPNENIYVNPAWNLGIKISKCDKVIISNDDVLYNINLFTDAILKLSTSFDKGNFGFLGMDFQNYSLEEDKKELMLKKHQNGMAWACVLALHKYSWHHIPEQLKIYYGDDFIRRKNSVNLFELYGLKVKSKISSSADTSVDWVKSITDNDKIEWDRLLQNGLI
jgi:hypothetical protein